MLQDFGREVEFLAGKDFVIFGEYLRRRYPLEIFVTYDETDDLLGGAVAKRGLKRRRRYRRRSGSSAVTMSREFSHNVCVRKITDLRQRLGSFEQGF